MRGTALLILAAALLIGGQGKSLAQEESLATVRFRALSWSGDIKGIYFAKASGKEGEEPTPIPMEVLPHRRSPFYEYKGPQEVFFFRDKGTAPDGTVIREVVARTKFTGAERMPLLLFFKNPAATGNAMKIKIIDDDPKKFPPGSFKMCNFSQQDVYVDLGGKKSKVEVGEMALVPAQTRLEGRAVRAEIGVGRDGEYKRVYSNGWNYAPNMRTLIFVIGDPVRKGHVACRRIQENAIFKKPAEEKAAGTGSTEGTTAP